MMTTIFFCCGCHGRLYNLVAKTLRASSVILFDTKLIMAVETDGSSTNGAHNASHALGRLETHDALFDVSSTVFQSVVEFAASVGSVGNTVDARLRIRTPDKRDSWWRWRVRALRDKFSCQHLRLLIV